MPNDIAAALVALLPRLRRYALALCRLDHLADDLVQHACERALATPRGPDEGVAFDAWMFRIVRNLWFDEGRREVRHGPHDSLDDEETDLHERMGAVDGRAVVEARLVMGDVDRALAHLPDEQREILMLCCVEEKSYREVSDLLGIPMGTVMSRLARARLRLVDHVEGFAGAPAQAERSVRHG